MRFTAAPLPLPLLLALALLAGPSPPRPARAEDDWPAARARFREAMRQADWTKRRDALLLLTAHDGAEAARELLAALQKEENAAVVMAGVETLGLLRSLGASQALVEAARSGKGRPRLLVLIALEKQRTPEVARLLVEVARGSDPLAAAQAALGLATDRPVEGFPVLLALLEHKDWQLRAAAARALAAYADREAVGPLAVALATTRGRARADVLAALEKITGQAFGNDPEAWKRLAQGADPGTIAAKPSLPPSFLGVPVYGERVVVVMDTSLRMGDPHGLDRDRLMALCEPPDGSPIPWFRLKTFGQLALAHLRHLADGLPGSARFEVLFFNEIVDRAFGKFVPAGAAQRRQLEDLLGKVKTDNGIATYAALDGALEVGGGTDEKAWKGGPDEVLFVTANTPTVGEVKEPHEVYAAVGLKARLRMVPVHTIVMNYHCPQCEPLSTRTGGRHVMIRPSD
jgi:hypothetical protein